MNRAQHRAALAEGQRPTDPRWQDTSPSAKAIRRQHRIASAARPAERAFRLWWWAQGTPNEAKRWDRLVDAMNALHRAIHDPRDTTSVPRVRRTPTRAMTFPEFAAIVRGDAGVGEHP